MATQSSLSHLTSAEVTFLSGQGISVKDARSEGKEKPPAAYSLFCSFLTRPLLLKKTKNKNGYGTLVTLTLDVTKLLWIKKI